MAANTAAGDETFSDLNGRAKIILHHRSFQRCSSGTRAMTTDVLTTECLDSVGFSRLHALVARGYVPDIGRSLRDDGHVCIMLKHPRAARLKAPPAITLWSDGIVSTNDVLWPEKYVPTEEGAPDWQRFILPAQGDRFEAFAASVERPDLFDLYLKPAYRHAKVFGMCMLFGSTLCVLLGFAGKLVVKA
jgi:hypothetical protein